ncbi:MAG TPA: septal ring lytic transglycosylase RlpA family protein [Alphaproteobacteria bacterium]|nr:septal ring lytic transglycosylase RlpA family protein [Alphaproteobacteria bacterium]
MISFGRWLLVGTAVAALAACAPKAPPVASAPPPAPEAPKGPLGPGSYKVGKPYQINGIWYYPKEDYQYDESGIASWYGPGFHQKTTANGEIFDQNEVTAAHPTLPLPSLVRVTNLENGRSINVRVNDRGPYAPGRILDLSRRSAQLLGVEQKGTARVRVQILAEESRQIADAYRAAGRAESLVAGTPAPQAAPAAKIAKESLAPPPGVPVASATASRAPTAPVAGASRLGQAPAPVEVVASNVPGSNVGGRFLPAETVQQGPPRPGQIYVQAGAFTSYDNANRLRARLSSLGRVTVAQANVQSTPFFRVRVGPLANVEDADRVLGQVVGTGQKDAKIVVD